MRLYSTNERSEKWMKCEENRESALPLLSKCDEIFLFDNEWAAWFLGLICYLNLPLNALQNARAWGTFEITTA